MLNLRQAVWVETLKARRSKMPLFTALGTALLPLAGGFFMIVLKDPEFARRVGLISAKAQLTVGTADWPSYFRFLGQASAAGGLVLFGFIAAWVFGREYSDRTVKDLLALPTARPTIVMAKFLVIGAWSLLLTGLLLLVGFGVGAAIVLPQASSPVMVQGMVSVAVTALLSILLLTPVAFFASAGHGYLPPLAVIMLTMVLAQVVAYAGWGEYFPWAIPGLYSQGQALGPVSYAILVLTGLVGIAGTVLWWELADQTR
jgi:ABC-2 type transport system permease protein